MLFLTWSLRQNELVADEYAFKMGYGDILASVLDRHMCSLPENGLIIVIEHYIVLPPREDLPDLFRGGKNSLFSVIQGEKWIFPWIFFSGPSKNPGKARVFEW